MYVLVLNEHSSKLVKHWSSQLQKRNKKIEIRLNLCNVPDLYRTCTAFVPDCTGLVPLSFRTVLDCTALQPFSTIFNSISSIFLLFSTIFFLLDGSKLKARRGAGLKRVFALVLLLFIAEARWRVVPPALPCR